jgi:hypothetical protein
MIYFNKFNPRSYRIVYVPCLTPGCNSTPLNFQINVFAAHLKYALKTNSNATLKLSCSKCGKTSEYTYEIILKIMPENLRPMPLPQNHVWAVLLYEFETAEDAGGRAFFGERLLIHLTKHQGIDWQGELISESQFAPTLRSGNILGGRIFNGHYVCEFLAKSNKAYELPIEGVPKDSDFGMFLVPKKGNVTRLQCANLFCSNPSCGYIFCLTYSKLKEYIKSAETKSHSHGDAGFTMVLSCELCGTCRVVDLASFDDLHKI